MITFFKGPYAFLSNFSPSVVWYEGDYFDTIEHAYQAAKTLNPAYRQRIQKAPTPGLAKSLGRKAPLRADWESIKIGVMRGLLRQKFTPNTPLASALLATGDDSLMEGNTWHDNFWGVCSCYTCSGNGENHLGRLLEETRQWLRA